MSQFHLDNLPSLHISFSDMNAQQEISSLTKDFYLPEESSCTNTTQTAGKSENYRKEKTVSETSSVFLTWREEGETGLTRVDLTEAALEWPLSRVNILRPTLKGEPGVSPTHHRLAIQGQTWL